MIPPTMLASTIATSASAGSTSPRPAATPAPMTTRSPGTGIGRPASLTRIRPAMRQHRSEVGRHGGPRSALGARDAAGPTRRAIASPSASGTSGGSPRETRARIMRIAMTPTSASGIGPDGSSRRAARTPRSSPASAAPLRSPSSSLVERRTSSVSGSTRSSTTAAITASSRAAAAATRSSARATDIAMSVKAHVPLNPERANDRIVWSRAAATASSSSAPRPATLAAVLARSRAASRAASGGATTTTWSRRSVVARSSTSATRARAAARLAGRS